MEDRFSKGSRISVGEAARQSEAEARTEGRLPGRRIEGGTAARRSEAEERSSVVRSPYGMKISARVGRPFTLEEDLNGPGERLPRGIARAGATPISVARDVVLRARGEDVLTATPAQQISSHEGKAEPKEQGSFQAGVSNLKALLPRGWFKD